MLTAFQTEQNNNDFCVPNEIIQFFLYFLGNEMRSADIEFPNSINMFSENSTSGWTWNNPHLASFKFLI